MQADSAGLLARSLRLAAVAVLSGALLGTAAAPAAAQPLATQQRAASDADVEARQGAAAYLRDAIRAIDARRIAPAGEALERAETRLLSQRTAEPPVDRVRRRARPSRNNFIGHIGAARDLLGRGDPAAARAQAVTALSLLDGRRQARRP